jgi:hypothetical protein
VAVAVDPFGIFGKINAGVGTFHAKIEGTW